jgi:hypothetical protein
MRGVIAAAVLLAGCEGNPATTDDARAGGDGLDPANDAPPEDTGDSDTDGPDDTDDTDPTDTDTDVPAPECQLASSSGVQVSDGYGLFANTYVYDAAGLLIEIEREYAPIDGVIDAVTLFSYDAAGNMLAEEFDDGADGTIDERKTWSYDAAGLPTLLEVDPGADGTIQATFTYTHDAAGLLVVHRFETEFDADDWQDTLLYSAGIQARIERDLLIDGSIDEVTDFVWGLDGIAVLESTTDPADASPIRSVTRTTDGMGGILTMLAEDFLAGTSLLLTYTYDGDGNVSTVERDSEGDGTATSLTTFVWDCL